MKVISKIIILLFLITAVISLNLNETPINLANKLTEILNKDTYQKRFLQIDPTQCTTEIEVCDKQVEEDA